MDSWEYDFYDYWDDLEYGDHTYWDYEGAHTQKQHQEQKAGQKRKRATPAKPSAMDKRRKVSSTQAATGSGEEGPGDSDVIFMSQQERARVAFKQAPILKDGTLAAFLPDWRKRYAEMDGKIVVDDMPADMKKAAQAKDEDLAEKAQQSAAEEDEEDWEDEDVEPDDEVEGEPVDALAALDPDMLKQILKQKLGDAGLGGMDEGAFMDTLRKMLAGDEEEAAGDLANTLLGQATGERGSSSSALTDWLSGQGVSLEADEEGDDASSVTTAELPESSGAHSGSGKSGAERFAAASQESLPKSGATVPESSRPSKEMAIHPVSPTRTQSKMVGGKKKRPAKRVTFDVPPEQGAEADAAPDIPVEEGVNDSHDGGDSAAGTTVTRASRTKASNTSAAAKKTAVSRTARGSKASAPDNQLQQELVDTVDHDDSGVKSAAEQPARQTRKRKADADEKQQDRGGGQRAVKEPTTRRTRSARAKTGGK